MPTSTVCVVARCAPPRDISPIPPVVGLRAPAVRYNRRMATNDWRNHAHPTRRELLARAGRAGLALGAGVPLAQWLAGCGDPATTNLHLTSSPTASATSQPTATPDTRPVTIAITGDVMLARSVNDHMLATAAGDRKSTRLNSSHVEISYAVFCLKKKKKKKKKITTTIVATKS